MPGEPDEIGMMGRAILGWVFRGLQHEVIAMAPCCKKMEVARRGITATAKLELELRASLF